MVGGSKFYEMLDGSQAADTATPSPTEKQDHMKPIESDDEGTETLLVIFLSMTHPKRDFDKIGTI